MSGETGFHIEGVGNDGETVFAIGEVIIAILASEQEQETIRVALAALTSTVPAQLAISHCNVTMGHQAEE